MYFDDFKCMDFESADFQTFSLLLDLRLHQSLQDFHTKQHLVIGLNEAGNFIQQGWILVFDRCSADFHARPQPFDPQ